MNKFRLNAHRLLQLPDRPCEHGWETAPLPAKAAIYALIDQLTDRKLLCTAYQKLDTLDSGASQQMRS